MILGLRIALHYSMVGDFMRSRFKDIYILALISAMGSNVAFGQAIVVADPIGHHNEIILHENHGGAHYVSDSAAILDQNKFLADLPQEPEKVLFYFIEKLNLNVDKYAFPHYRVEYFPPGSQISQPELSVNYGTDGIVVTVRVNAKYIKNPVYLLDIFLRMNDFFSTGTKLAKSQLLTYKDYHSYYHPHHGWVTDHHKEFIVSYHEHHYQSMTNALGLKLVSSADSLTPFEIAELQTNAKMGSVYSQRQWLKYNILQVEQALDNYSRFKPLLALNESDKIQAIQQMAEAQGIKLTTGQSSSDLAAQYFQQRKNLFLREFNSNEQAARSRYRVEQLQLKDSKKMEEKDSLEKLSFKLNDYLLRNDRKGVADLIESYLPFDVMEPVEKGLWSDWLEAIRNPDKNQSFVLYRGLDSTNDKLQSLKTPEGLKTGLFSVLLNRNQGSFTRRLRSLTTMRYKFMTGPYGAVARSPIDRVPTMSSLMLNHASSPNGSPMLSFTTDVAVAKASPKVGLLRLILISVGSCRTSFQDFPANWKCWFRLLSFRTRWFCLKL